MRFEEFERKALQSFESIPAEFRVGIDKLVIERGSRVHPQLPDFFTLGECVHRDWHPENTPLFSSIHLYFGSFLAVARDDPRFDIPAEIEETIRHELRHHLEDRADIPDLADEDEAAEQNERRRNALPFRADFYRLGARIDEHAWDVDGDVFVEIELRRRDAARASGKPLRVRFGPDVLEVDAPATLKDREFVEVPGGWEDDDGSGGDLFVVIVAR